MTHRFRRHERFDRVAAADPALQLELEAGRATARAFVLDCLDFLEGRQTPGAARARAEHDRLTKLNREAKRRALCGADPLNITGHSPAKPVEHKLARAPVEHVGQISRVVPAVNRLYGKNKLDLRQHVAADTYRNAFETVRSIMGGALNFDRAVGTGFANRSPTEACLLAAETLTQAKRHLGAQAIVIIESIVCDGHSIEECTRRIYDVRDGEKPSARDINYIGRRLREGLSELADLWHPRSRRPPMQNYRPAQGEIVVGDAGVRDMDVKPFVMR